MLLSSRSLRRSVLYLLCLIPGVCAAQGNQFLKLPKVQPTTGGRVTSFTTGTFQQPTGGTDILYVSAPILNGTTSSITVGELLNQGGAGFADLGENQIAFSGVSNVVAAEGNFLGTGFGYAFALTPAVSGTATLCVYAGTGAQPPSITNPTGGGSSYSGGNAYPPTTGTSGCLTVPTLGTSPRLDYMAAFPFRQGLPPQLIVEDSANNYLYVLSLNGAVANGGLLSGVVVTSVISIPPADGAGPIYVGDFNGDGKMDFIVNNQGGSAATVYLGNGDGTFKLPPVRYVFDVGVRYMLMQDMDGDGIADVVVEGTNGVIEIHKGNTDGTFATASEGGTALTPGSAAGEGGRLAAINPRTLDILTTTPIGLSLLQRQSGTLTYALKTIYNIGPGRTSFALVDFHGTGNLDLAVDSAEGVAFLTGNPDGTFQASNAYSALAPGLGAAVGQFRNVANNSTGIRDVVVATGATQAQLLKGNGDGTFSTLTNPANVSGGPSNISPNLWSNILSGDFNGDGNFDIAYSLTGLPLPIPGSATAPGLYIQLGNGDGTFSAPLAIASSSVAAPGNNNFCGKSAVGDFNGDSVSDIANIDLLYDDTLLGQRSGTPFLLGMVNRMTTNQAFNMVAAGCLKAGCGGKQDLLAESGATLIPYINSGDGKTFKFQVKATSTGTTEVESQPVTITVTI